VASSVEGRRRSVGLIVWEMTKAFERIKDEIHILQTEKEKRLTGLVTSCVETVFYTTLLMERQRKWRKWRENEEEEVRSYCMTLRKREDNGDWNGKH
jgi:hypothetical protein